MALMIGIYLALGMLSYILMKQQEKSQTASNFNETVAEDIFNSIQIDINLDTLSDHVKIIFNSYDRKSKGELSEYGLVAILEDVYTKYASKAENKDRLKCIMGLINKQKEKDPYYGLRFEQEVVIKYLEEELYKSDDTDSSYSHIEEIKEVVRRQNSEIDELKKNNAWTIPVGILGIILTTVFGLIGLIYPFVSRYIRQQE